MKFLASLTCALALVASAIGQAPPLQRNPFTTNVLGGGLTNLSDVRIERPTITDGDVLTWNDAAGKWTNSPSTGAGELSFIYQASPTNATRANLFSSKVANTNYLRTIEGSNGITVNVMGGGTNLFITLSDPELLVWSTHTTNTFVRTNDSWLDRVGSNRVELVAGTAIGVSRAASGVKQLWTVEVNDPELLIWATHTTNTFVRTNDLWLDRVASNRIVLAAGPGIAISTVAVGNKQVSTVSSLGGSLESVVVETNVILYGSFGYLFRSNDVVLPYNNGAFTLTNYSGFIGSNFTGSAANGFITNGMPDGMVDINASVNMQEAAVPSGNLHVNLMVNGLVISAKSTIINNGSDMFEHSLMATHYLHSNDTVSILFDNGDASTAVVLNSYLRVRSYDQRATIVTTFGGFPALTGAGGIEVVGQGTNFIISASNLVITSISGGVTNIGDARIATMIWNGPNTIRWGPTNDGILTGGGIAPTNGGNARTWSLEVYPGGYTNLTFPGVFTWIDGGPFYQPNLTNIFDLRFTGSNFLAFTRPNGTLSAASANISGHWIAPPSTGIIGGMNGGSQIRTNLLADNTMLVISNLINETEVEIWSRGPIATISNSTSIQWLEGSQPYISTNGRTLLRFWMADGVTNGMVLAQQIVNFVPGNDINFTTDMPNNKITIHSTASGGAGGSPVILNVNPNQFEISDESTLNFKNAAFWTNGLVNGNLTVQSDPETGQGGGIAGAYISSVRYIDIGVTNLGTNAVTTMVWDGPGHIRWAPAGDGILTGGGTAPQQGDAGRVWQIEILPNGAQRIVFPGAFEWQDGGPFFSPNVTNLYEVRFTTTNYLARRLSPLPAEYRQTPILRGTNFWVDGGMSLNWRVDVAANVGGLTNLLFTNMPINREITVELFLTNGVTLQAPQFTTNQWDDGMIPLFATNSFLRLRAKRTGLTETNVTLGGGGYRQVFGTNIVVFTNHADKTITVNAAGGGGGFPPYAIHEDFICNSISSGQIGQLGWISSGAAVAGVLVNGRYGVIQITTTAGNTNTSSIQLGLNSTHMLVVSNYPSTNKLILALGGASSTSNSIVMCGWARTPNVAGIPVDSVSFVATNGAAGFPGNWFGINSIGGVQAIADTGVSASTVNYYTNELRNPGDGTVTYAVNGVASAPVNGISSIEMTPYFRIVTTEAAIKLLNVDYWGIRPVANR